MINKKLFFYILAFIFGWHPIVKAKAIAAAKNTPWNYQTRGFLSARLSSYTHKKSQNYGQLTNARLEQSAEISNYFSSLNQLRWNSNSFASDLSVKTTPLKKDTFDVLLGENYLKYKSDNWVAQIGYQEVVWGEAFGFNYADIINPKDERLTFYSDAADARMPLFLFNGKSFFKFKDLSGSWQMLYSPEPRFSKTIPIDVYIGDIFSQATMTVSKEKTPHFFKSSEVGGKLSISYQGFDIALYSFSYLDRNPHYLLSSASTTNITFQEKHNRLKSSGLSIAKAIADYVLRADIVYTQNKTINYLQNLQLKNYSTKALNTLISLDTPTYNDYSGILIFAQSSLKDIKNNSFREKSERYLVGKMTKSLDKDKNFEFSYVYEMGHPGHSIQTSLSWPISAQTDLKFGGEFYFGDTLSNFKKLKNVSSAFLSIKNYFQL